LVNWTSPKAYLVGAILGDGTLYDQYRSNGNSSKKYKQRVIELKVTERTFAEHFSRTVNDAYAFLPKVSSRFITQRNVNLPNFPPFYQKMFFITRITRKCVVTELEKLICSLKEIQMAPESVRYAFLKGFFDAEGNINQCGRRLSIRWTNTKRKLCLFMLKLLEKLGFHPKLYYRRSRPLYTVQVHRKAEVKRLLSYLVVNGVKVG
jgi:intein-encoded DNA endonuclease-like protein